MKKGLFVVFEGGEGTGKSTQIHSLKAFLEKENFEVLLSWEPGGTPIGEKIREILLSPSSKGMDARCEALLYAAARAEHVQKVLRPAIERGAIVLCDRYWDASRAYQGFARGLGFSSVDQINFWATEGLFPDRVYFFDLDPQVGLARVNKRQDGRLDRMEQEKMDFHQKIRAAYQFIARQSPERYLQIDASQSVAAVQKLIEDDFRERLLKGQ